MRGLCLVLLTCTAVIGSAHGDRGTARRAVVVARKVEVADGPSVGPRAAPVTVEVFCNVTSRRRCQRVFGVLEKLVERHPGELRVVFRALPGPSQVDQFSAMEKEAWEQGRFFELQRVVYAQVVLIPGRDLQRIAEEAGLDAEALGRALADGEHERALALDHVWASRYGAVRAPTLVWNGEQGAGDDTLAELEASFEDARARAEELLARGIAVHRLPELFAERAQRRQVETLAADVARVGNHELDLDRPRVSVPRDGSPTDGPAQAAVTVTFFYDAHCYPCTRLHETMRRLRLAYGDRIRMVFKAFPNYPEHSRSLEAALCAHRMGAFLPFFEILMTPRGGRTELEAHVQKAGLDPARFEELVDSGVCAELVREEAEQGNRVGVTRSPTVFVNGLLLEGLRTFDELRLVIDEELRPGLLGPPAE